MAKILVVEDDKDLADRLSDWLTFEHHTVDKVENGQDARDFLGTYAYDLVILDLRLPDMSGITVLKEFRFKGGNTPVLILTGKREIQEKEEGLDAGADDYLTKPFDTRELSARVRALLRRPKFFSGDNLTAGDISLDPVAHKVSRAGVELVLQPLEFALLEFLLRHPNQVFSAEGIINHVWGADSDASIDTLRTYVKTLRKKIDRDGAPSMIKTVHGVGYKLEI